MIYHEKTKLDISLTDEMLLLLIRGKRCHWVIDGLEIIMHPPKEGTFITNIQYLNLKATCTNMEQDSIFYEIEHD